MSAESPKYQQARAKVPEDLRPTFDRLVKEYEFLTKVRYGRGYVAYEVLAGLVLAGWRPSATPHPDSVLADA